MPGHEGAVPGSRYRRWRVPWVGCTRAVAPYLLCEVLAVILVSWVALRLRSLLRGSCFGTVVPWGLASFYRVCGGDAGLVLPGPARLVGSLLQSWCLVLGPRLPRLSPSVRLLPLGRFDGGFFGFRLHFLGISRSVFGYVWFLLFLELLASFCPGSDGRVGGSAGLGLHPPASVPPDPATRLSGWPHWVTIPPKLQSAFYSAGKYSVGTNGVLRKLKHIFPNTYQRINMMARLPPR